MKNKPVYIPDKYIKFISNITTKKILFHIQPEKLIKCLGRAAPGYVGSLIFIRQEKGI